MNEAAGRRLSYSDPKADVGHFMIRRVGERPTLRIVRAKERPLKYRPSLARWSATSPPCPGADASLSFPIPPWSAAFSVELELAEA